MVAQGSQDLHLEPEDAIKPPPREREGVGRQVQTGSRMDWTPWLSRSLPGSHISLPLVSVGSKELLPQGPTTTLDCHSVPGGVKAPLTFEVTSGRIGGGRPLPHRL